MYIMLCSAGSANRNARERYSDAISYLLDTAMFRLQQCIDVQLSFAHTQTDFLCTTEKDHPLLLYAHVFIVAALFVAEKSLEAAPLNTKLYSLKVLFRLVPPSFTCISTSARS